MEKSDLFQVPYDLFYSKRHSITENNLETPEIKKLSQKLKFLVDNHACLNDTETNMKPVLVHSFNNSKKFKKWLPDNKVYTHSPTTNHNNHNHHSNHQSNHQSKDFNRDHSRKSYFDNNRKNQHFTYKNHELCCSKIRHRIGDGNDFNRNVLSILNKVSPQNIQKLSKQIALLCDTKENTEYIVLNVLKKAHKDYAYVDLYMFILKNIPDIFSDIIFNATTFLMANFLYTLPKIITDLVKNIEGENNLSKYIKAKKDIFDINKTICTLMVYGFITVDPILYLSNIKDLFDKMTRNNNNEIYDIFIHFLYDFFSVHTSNAVLKSSHDMINDLFDKRNDEICSKKTNFKWMDLLKFFQPR